MQPLDHHTGLRNPHHGRKVTCGDSPHKLLCAILKGSRSGQDLAEFAIIFPLLLLIIFGVLDLGRGFFSAITIANAAREGARYAIAYGLTYDLVTDTFIPETTEIRNQVIREAGNAGLTLDPSNITVACPTGCGPGEDIRVSVSYQFNLLLDVILPDITINRHAEMMVP
jgi:Flp pilus assembly protein TadG